MAPQVRARLRKVGIVAIVGIGAALPGCERAAAGDPDRAAFQPHPLYRLEPIPNLPDRGAAGPHDELGLRGAPFPKEAPVRVLVLGGASVYGAGDTADKSLPIRLQRALRTLGVQAAVANGGCPGHCAFASMLRAHFLLAPLKPTQILYIAGREDLDIYGAPNFVADLGHVPRPWTGASMPPGAALTEAGAAAFRRDILSLEVEARLVGAQLYLVAPSDPALASLREPLERVARERQAHFLDLPSDPELAVQMLARAVQGQ